jgi:hypothetical protein
MTLRPILSEFPNLSINLNFFFISAEGSLMQKNYKEVSPVVYSAFNVKITQPL